jgi:hypothetical protein
MSRLAISGCPLSLIEKVYTTFQVPTLDGSWVEMRDYIPRAEGDFLYTLVRQLSSPLKNSS